MFANVKSGLSAARPGSAEWWRHRLEAGRPAGRPRKNGLTLDRIFDTTLAIIEDEGLEAVNMRRIAECLGTGPASLYRHVTGREELLVLLADRLLDTNLAPVELPVDWRTGCERIANEFLRLLLNRPALAALASQGQMLGPCSLRGREQVLAWLVREGFSGTLAVHTYLLLTRYVIGSLHTYGRSSKQDAAERKQLVRLFKTLSPAEFPTVVQLAEVLGGQRPEDVFQFGLATLLDGIAACRERELQR